MGLQDHDVFDNTPPPPRAYRIKDAQQTSYATAKAHGFWDDAEQANVPSKLALAAGELVGEALEDFREGRMALDYEYKSTEKTARLEIHKGAEDSTTYIGWPRELYQRQPQRVALTPENARKVGFEVKPVGFGIELADAVIRIFDLAEHLGIDMEEMIGLKMAYNRTRPYRHNRKV